jgi:phosphatidylinositol alpha-1,6-mannosyltransferase
MDVLIDAAVRLRPERPDLTVAIAGTGRDQDRLAGRIREYSAPVRLLGEVSHADLPRLVGAADVFAMLCRNRWLGLEQEGFGIVFLEAAAAGVPQVAGRSGGAGEAVLDGITGTVLRRSTDVAAAVRAIAELVDDRVRRMEMGKASRQRAEGSFDYDKLAPRLAASLADVEG